MLLYIVPSENEQDAFANCNRSTRRAKMIYCARAKAATFRQDGDSSPSRWIGRLVRQIFKRPESLGLSLFQG
jgi:hypothetical protein